jgi:hypothetical protein
MKELKLWFIAINKAMELDFEKSKLKTDTLDTNLTIIERNKILNEYLTDEGDYLNHLKTLKKVSLVLKFFLGHSLSALSPCRRKR